MPYTFGSGVNSVYLSDILGSGATSLLGHSNLTVNWKLYIDGITAPVSVPITVEAVAYMSKTGCNAVLDSDNLTLTRPTPAWLFQHRRQPYATLMEFPNWSLGLRIRPSIL
jgi:hypothetical protein